MMPYKYKARRTFFEIQSTLPSAHPEFVIGEGEGWGGGGGGEVNTGLYMYNLGSIFKIRPLL